MKFKNPTSKPAMRRLLPYESTNEARCSPVASKAAINACKMCLQHHIIMTFINTAIIITVTYMININSFDIFLHHFSQLLTNCSSTGTIFLYLFVCLANRTFRCRLPKCYCIGLLAISDIGLVESLVSSRLAHVHVGVLPTVGIVNHTCQGVQNWWPIFVLHELWKKTAFSTDRVQVCSPATRTELQWLWWLCTDKFQSIIIQIQALY